MKTWQERYVAQEGSIVECMQAEIDELYEDRYVSLTGVGLMKSEIDRLREALERPAQHQQEPDRVKFERHWRKTRGDKKANRELPRHPLQPQTYIQDSANRHWVTWQAAVRSVAPQADRKPLAYAELMALAKKSGLGPEHVSGVLQARLEIYGRAIEAAHGIKEQT